MILNVLLGLNFLALTFIGRSLWTIAKARAFDMGRKNQREAVIGFGPTIIKANATATFVAEPTADYEGQRLIVPSSLSNFFAIADIVVGEESQAVSAHPIPAAAFSELAVGVSLGLAKANQKTPLTLKIVNTTNIDQTFSAAFIGFVAKDAVLDSNSSRGKITSSAAN